MLSVLIPVFNYPVVSLVETIHRQAIACGITFEIVVLDDGSTLHTEANMIIDRMAHCSYERLTTNVGRSAIRNQLAAKATYDTLLFIDAGTMPKSDTFIHHYIQELEHAVVVGGMTCLAEKPAAPYRLRWLYTRQRESTVGASEERPVICSSNFRIRKSIFDTIQFDASLTRYGCEDVLFFDTIAQQSITITYIDNPVIHDAGDDATTFVQKTEHALENLLYLINNQKIAPNRFRVASLYGQLHRWRLDRLVLFLFKVSKKSLLRNFNSATPSLRYFDFYKLGYFCSLKHKK